LEVVFKTIYLVAKKLAKITLNGCREQPFEPTKHYNQFKSIIQETKLMKKIACTLALLLMFSIIALADGDIGAGGKSCPQGQTCLVISPQPPPAPVEPAKPDDSTVSDGETSFKELVDYLKSLFE
jgi:hypothetical protein